MQLHQLVKVRFGGSFAGSKDLYQIYKTFEKLYEFLTVLADWADLGSQKLFSKLTTISQIRHMKIFKLRFKNISKSEKAFKPKKDCRF